jgi:aryl-alcohol dehydrogenase-like predicted oxidoreductase
MQYRRLGKTGLNLSVLSLGSGGLNRFGQLRYVSRKSIHGLVRRALDLGINYFDTASGYSDSESILGEALRGIPRDQYYLSSKVFPLHENVIISAAEAQRLVERSLHRLGVETLDILFFHKVPPEVYEATLDRLMPTVQSLRAAGKIRHIGITESSKRDRQHRMLKRALQDDLFDTIMVSYQIANCTAEQEVLPMALAKDVGVVGMVAARHLVHRNIRERLKLFQGALRSLVSSPPDLNNLKLRLQAAYAPLLQISSSGEHSIAREGREGILKLPTAGYTFVVSHPAVATVLTGTTNPVHLQQNVEAAMAPVLTSKEIDQLRKLLQ